jgi:hypothetical protein
MSLSKDIRLSIVRGGCRVSLLYFNKKLSKIKKITILIVYVKLYIVIYIYTSIIKKIAIYFKDSTFVAVNRKVGRV